MKMKVDIFRNEVCKTKSILEKTSTTVTGNTFLLETKKKEKRFHLLQKVCES